MIASPDLLLRSERPNVKTRAGLFVKLSSNTSAIFGKATAGQYVLLSPSIPEISIHDRLCAG